MMTQGIKKYEDITYYMKGKKQHLRENFGWFSSFMFV